MNPDEVKRQIQELEQLRAQVKRWRTCLILAIISIVVGAVIVIIDSALDLMRSGPQQEEFVTELSNGLKEDVVPHLEAIGRQTLNETKPLIEKELKKLNERSPEMALALKKETLTLTHNLPIKGEKILENTFGAMLKKREAKIRETYPEATEARVASLVANLTEVAHERAESAAETLFQPHIEALHKITSDLETIKKTEDVNLNEDLPTWEMAITIFDVVREDFKGLETEADAVAAKHPKTKKEAK